MHNYRSQQYLIIQYILLDVLTFLCHHQGVLNLCLAKLHTFLKLKLLKLQFHKIIKILFNRCFAKQ